MLLNGTAEMFSDHSPTSTDTPSKRKKRAANNSGVREPPPQPGDGLLSELHGILNELNSPPASKGKTTSSKSIPTPPPRSPTVTMTGNDLQIGKAAVKGSPGVPNLIGRSTHFAKLQEEISQKRKEINKESLAGQSKEVTVSSASPR